MKNYFILFVLSVISIASIAQDRSQGRRGYDMSNFNGVVTGKVVDSLDRTPVEYATVALYRQKDSSLVTGSLTDESGKFIIEKLKPGRYYAEIKFIGYETRRIGGIAITPRSPNINLETCSILAANENIEAVVVTGEKKMLLHNLDKKVFNVDKDVSVEGGTAADVLENIPSIEVDTDGNVSLRGSSNVNILIDGRPSMLTSMDELPAQMIERVEVITNPSAKYDPDGNTGIINIVIKKRKEPGYNGMVSFNAGSGDKYSAIASMNWRQEKVNLFASYSFRKGEMNRYSLGNRVTFFENTTDSSFLDQNSTGQAKMMFHNIRGGFDFFLDNKTTLSFTGNLNFRSFDMGTDLFSNSYNNFNSDFLQNNRITNNGYDGLGHEYSLNFKRKYDIAGKEWTADVFFSRRNNDFLSDISEEEIFNSITSPDVFERATNDDWMNAFTAQTDYVAPIGNGGRLETGVKAFIRKSDADYVYNVFNTSGNIWEYDATRSNHFIYTEQIFSAYGIYSNTFADGKFSYQLGLRVEDQLAKSELKNTNTVADTNRLNFFPTAHIRWEPSNAHSFQLSYSRRVNRPYSRVLNPFLNTSDKYNWSQGNPYLEPEFTSSIDLSYNLNLRKTKVTASVYYRDTRNGFSRNMKVLTQDDLNAMGFDTLGYFPTLSTFINLSHYENWGSEFVLTQNIAKWWRINASYSYYYSKLYGDVVSGADEGSSWNVKLASYFTIGKNVDLQVRGNYRAPSVTVGGSGRGFHMIGGAQGETKEMFWFDLGARIYVLKRKGTITVNVRDIFDTRKLKYSSWDTNFYSYNENWRDSRMIFVGFSYRINNYKMRQTKNNEMDDSFDIIE
ncbi:TonB-dependent receptor domain-containing protein [Tenuifilum thalassicum]|uniref:TonB-dependent receptor n=1 Tax=Tenuifilum thalassicum TaxID=2590900 RepID=A0A7D3XWL8_9BACT|nr:TonB-dependent receptor [Tenuifilum thalassicum]QKG80511.1 TonB-dependent receptor [Tenuifilum thalassicum]